VSESVECAKCHTVGRRRRGCIAPDGWFYTEIVTDDDPRGTCYRYACSEACCAVDWLHGPGDLGLRNLRQVTVTNLRFPCIIEIFDLGGRIEALGSWDRLCDDVFLLVPEGTYVLQVKALGFRSFTLAIDVGVTGLSVSAIMDPHGISERRIPSHSADFECTCGYVVLQSPMFAHDVAAHRASCKMARDSLPGAMDGEGATALREEWDSRGRLVGSDGTTYGVTQDGELFVVRDGRTVYLDASHVRTVLARAGL
jgi:hypothetical protein